MSKRYDGGPAFPQGDPDIGGHPGMSLRDWFAGQALAGIMGNSNEGSPAGDAVYCAADAYRHADRMLKQREE